ncbi:FkbM family methyltransferase [Chamaesiphon sp.]|uniref:FkbM family methyltransferase n=1 Tax=Chamaesiphon sp. TaxID=2814140 RepID=UPI003592FC7E
MQTETPYWLTQAYSEAISKTDVGLVYRNNLYAPIVANILHYLYPDTARFLDYGGGYGLFVRMMRDRGFDFNWEDKYCQNLFAQGFECDPIGTNLYTLLTSFEVFEHLVEPRTEIERMLSLAPDILFSTELMPSHRPKPDEWWYYGLEHGQHIAFFNVTTLRYLAKEYGLNFYTNGASLHFLTSRELSSDTFMQLCHRELPVGIRGSLISSDYQRAVKLIASNISDSSHSILSEKQQKQINKLMPMVSELQGKDLQVASSTSNRVEPQIPLTEFQIGKYNILIQTDHALPGYQVNYPLYDRFLPFLVANTASSDWAIDVGANVGDTLFAILDRKSDAKVLCIEGDDDFFELMKINIERNKALTQSAEIEASCYLVGTGNLKGSLAGVGGTKGLVLDNDIASETFATKVLGLDEIIKKHNIGIDRIKLLKVDTDGFDFDVITSGKNLLSQQKPLIYFENQISNDSQRQGYEKMYELLRESGYTTFYVFDNFGALMLKTHSIEALDYLNTYMQFQNKQQATRTCYYYDILCAANDDDIAICDRSIADYHTWINNRQLSEISQSSIDKNNLCEPIVAIDGVFFQLYRTGIARVWKSLLEEWANTEFGNHLVVLDRVGTAPKVEGISYYQIPAYDYNNTDADREMLQQVCDELGAELFISTYYTTPLETPSVFMGYDMIPEVVGADLNQPMWQEKQRGIAHASAFLTISEHTAKDLLKYYPEIDPTTVTPALCGVQPVFKPAQPSDIKKWSTSLGITKPYFLLVGAGGGYKNTILFWQGFAQLANNSDFDIVCTGAAGIGTEEYSTYAPGSQVHCLQLDDRSLNLAYAGAIALIYPSKYEGFGLPIIEALASGCPVITCHNASIPEVAGTCAIYIDDTSIEEMTQALTNVQQPEICDPLIAQGLIQSQKFSWGKMAGIIQSVLLDRTLAHLQLNSKNLIIFPDWSADEEELGEELSQIFDRLAQFDSEPLTLLIDTSNSVDLEAANMLVSTVAMNIMMSADIDITEQFEIAFTGELAPIQWQALLPKLQGRIKLDLEDVRSIESSGANLISEIQLTESPALTSV